MIELFDREVSRNLGKLSRKMKPIQTLELPWDELVTMVRKRLNDNIGSWGQISGDLAKVESSRASAIYRWMREFSDAKYVKVDGGRLSRLAQVMGLPVSFRVPLRRTNGATTRARSLSGSHRLKPKHRPRPNP